MNFSWKNAKLSIRTSNTEFSKLFFYAKIMVEVQSKSATQAPTDRPPIRVPPKRTFSEAQGALPKQLGADQAKEAKEPLRPTQRRRSNPLQPRLDVKAIMKLVPALSERELKQLVNTIVRRKKREEVARNRRPSEQTSARGMLAVAPEPETRTSSAATTRLPPPEQRPVDAPTPLPKMSTLGPGGPLNTAGTQEMKPLKDSPRTEESILASALLRQAHRRVIFSF